MTSPRNFSNQPERLKDQDKIGVISVNLNDREIAFYSKDTAEMLSISPVTLRKWSQELEKHGWTFSKDGHDRRAYTQSDLVALRYLRDIMRDRRETLENASIAVINRYKDSENTTRSLTDLPDRLPWEDQLKLVTSQQMAYMQQMYDDLSTKFMQRFDEQERYIEEQLKIRDEKLTQTLNEILETKKLIQEREQEQKKGFFKRLFSK